MSDRKCPFCGSRDVAAAMMGMPAYSWELGRRLENFDSAIAGQEDLAAGDAYRCNNCGRSFTDAVENERK